MLRVLAKLRICKLNRESCRGTMKKLGFTTWHLSKKAIGLMTLYYRTMVELAKRLVAYSFADHVFFSNSGTEANEAAIKFARKFQRHSHPNAKEPPTEFVSFTNSFHGRTMGALALTSKEHYQSPFEPVMPVVTFVEYGNIQATKELSQEGKTAAVFVEPIRVKRVYTVQERNFYNFCEVLVMMLGLSLFSMRFDANIRYLSQSGATPCGLQGNTGLPPDV